MKIDINEKEVTPIILKNAIKVANALGAEFDWFDIEAYSNPNLTISIDFEKDGVILSLEIGENSSGYFIEPGPVFKDFLGILTEENFNNFITELKNDLKKYFKKQH